MGSLDGCRFCGDPGVAGVAGVAGEGGVEEAGDESMSAAERSLNGGWMLWKRRGWESVCDGSVELS